MQINVSSSVNFSRSSISRARPASVAIYKTNESPEIERTLYSISYL